MHTHTYDLAFVGSMRRPRAVPTIVFSIDTHHLPELIDRLHKTADISLRREDAYVGTRKGFTLPTPDLFEKRIFGFGACGECTIVHNTVRLAVRLEPDVQAHYASLTISVLTDILSTPFEKARGSNRVQPIYLATRCKTGEPYGHAVSGWVSNTVTEWIAKYAAEASEHGNLTRVMHSHVVRAMQATWLSLAPHELKKYARSPHSFFYGHANNDGRFSLTCFGDACDLSIYPDQLSEGALVTSLGCHNLDTEIQQLTLLAGFAKLCELARA